MTSRLLIGDCRDRLRELAAESVNCVVTSPPYFALRDYGVDGIDWPEVTYSPMPGLAEITIPAMNAALGLEPSPEAFTAHLVAVFREVYRVLRRDGVVFLNLGDSYAGARRGPEGDKSTLEGSRRSQEQSRAAAVNRDKMPTGLKEKDLIGVPWRVAFALQAEGWYLRQWMPWVKRSAMPESCKDRPTVATETWFMLTKSERYAYDYAAGRRKISAASQRRLKSAPPVFGGSKGGGDQYWNFRRDGSKRAEVIVPGATRGTHRSDRDDTTAPEDGRRAFRNSDLFYQTADAPHGAILDADGAIVALDVATANFDGPHFATFPPALVEPLVMVGCPDGGVVMDIFAGAGTVGLVAEKLGRDSVLIEASRENGILARDRIRSANGRVICADIAEERPALVMGGAA